MLNGYLIVENSGAVVGSFTLAFELAATVRLYQSVPQSFYQNLTYFYVDVFGDYFEPACRCLFSDTYSNSTVWVDPTHLKCSVPVLELKDRFPQERTVVGYFVDLSVVCNISKSLETLSFFIKYGTVIEAMSTSQIRQNEYDFFPYIYLMGQFFNPN